MPRDGPSAFAAMGPEQAGFLERLVEAHDGWSLPWFTDEQLDAFYGAHGLTAADLAWMRRHVTPQPMATYREPLGLDRPSRPRTYVRCTRTPFPPPVTQQDPGWEWAEIDAGHWPMVTAPHTTAAILDAIAR